MTRRRPAAGLGAALLSLASGEALAHASDRGHVLLLPTGHYLVGGALAVAASFLALILLSGDRLPSLFLHRLQLGSIAKRWRLPASWFSFLVFVMLVVAGVIGSRDPLSNPLPLTVWTLLWVGLTLLHGLFGNLWAWLNPWYGPWRLANAMLPRRPALLPAWLGMAPALGGLVAFTSFELIDPAPDDPYRLAVMVAAYWLITFAAMLVFGYGQWSRRGEFLSVFFGMVSRLAFVAWDREGARLQLTVGLPGNKLTTVRPLPASGVAFLVAALASVSFDGFSRTFAWLGFIGVNPLEYPGRTALIGANSLGLLFAIVALTALFLAAVYAGEALTRRPAALLIAAGLLVWSLLPIALAYHAAHYLTALLVNGQYALVALSDPFDRGWNLFGTANWPVEAGIVMGAFSAWWLWNVQAAIIVGGHVLAVLAAHLLAARLHHGRDIAASQLPLTILMVGYTVFGLWLLSTPTGA